MKILGSILAALALCLGGPATAAGAGAGAGDTCAPYTIPVQSTVVACGSGQMGSKYKTQSKVCPSGAVTQSADYDTSGCVAPPSPAGSVNIVSRCALTPDACAPSPTAAACPTGTHWVLTGSNIAHCVQDDMACPWSYSLKHDFLGNPSCQQNTCPSNQQLQGDGISCACPVNTVWNGSSCVPAPPTCTASSSQVNGTSCAYGYTGTMYQTQTTTCPGGPYGSPSTTTSGYDTSTCTAMTVTCTSSSNTQSASCAPQNGTQWRTVTTSCPSGPYGSPSTGYGSWNTAGCSCANGGSDYPTCTPPPPPPPPCSPSSTSSASACGAGYTGTKYYVTNYTCPSGSSSYWDTSSCGCANGGSNYPTCTPPPPTCTPSSSTTSQACGAGYTGTMYQTTNYLCPSGTSTSWDKSGCGCANGGTNYPTCTPPVAAPPPQPAPTINSEGWYEIDASGTYQPDPYGGSIIASDCRYTSPDSQCHIRFAWSISNASSVSVSCTGPWGNYSDNSASWRMEWTDPPAGTTQTCTITATNSGGTTTYTDSMHFGN